MPKYDLTKKKLEKLLKKAEAKHSEFEKQLGKKDKNWPRWYADFIIASLSKN